jgi:hypothetical protein
MSFELRSSSLLTLRVPVPQTSGPVKVQIFSDKVIVDEFTFPIPYCGVCNVQESFFEVDELSPRRATVSLVAQDVWTETILPAALPAQSWVAAMEEWETAWLIQWWDPIKDVFRRNVLASPHWLSLVVVVAYAAACLGFYGVVFSSSGRHFGPGLFWFQKGLSLVMTCVWISCFLQVKGLCGPSGICPVDAKALSNLVGGDLRRHCFLGMVSSIVFGLNIFPAAACFASVWLFRAVKNAGGIFFQLQFDNLMIETGWIGALAFLAPLRWVSFDFEAAESTSTRIAIFLLHFLLFRLLFSSGLVKLTSKDASWASCSALEFHYFTQPIPLRAGVLVS